MAFDIIGAKQAGATDEEIAAYLSSKVGFRYDDAIAAGATPQEIIGHLSQKPEIDIAGQEKSGAMRRVADYGVTALKGAIGLPEAFVGLADIPTGGRVGKALESVGYRPAEARKILDTLYSPEQQEANRRVAEADGFVDTVKTAAENPSTIAHAVVESAPSMLGGAGIARNLLARGVTALPVVAGAVGEGAVAAGSAAEQIRDTNEDRLLTPKQSAIALGSGAATGALGLAGGKVAQKLGISDVDTILASGKLSSSQQNVLRRVAEGVFSEGILEELPQSAQEQVAQNLATDRPWNEGVAESAAMGMLAGGVMGGGAQILASKPAVDVNTDTVDLTTGAAVTPPAPPAAPSAVPVEPVTPPATPEAGTVNGVLDALRNPAPAIEPNQPVDASDPSAPPTVGPAQTPVTGGEAAPPPSSLSIHEQIVAADELLKQRTAELTQLHQQASLAETPEEAKGLKAQIQLATLRQKSAEKALQMLADQLPQEEAVSGPTEEGPQAQGNLDGQEPGGMGQAPAAEAVPEVSSVDGQRGDGVPMVQSPDGLTFDVTGTLDGEEVTYRVQARDEQEAMLLADKQFPGFDSTAATEVTQQPADVPSVQTVTAPETVPAAEQPTIPGTDSGNTAAGAVKGGDTSDTVQDLQGQGSKEGQVPGVRQEGLLTPRTLDIDGRATDGKPIMPGDQFKTSSGRMTTPYPKQKGEKYASQWLIDNAMAEAEARGDRFNKTSFSGEKPLKRGDLPQASRDSMLMYLFGEQPKVVPSILKPLVPKESDKASTALETLERTYETQRQRVESAVAGGSNYHKRVPSKEAAAAWLREVYTKLDGGSTVMDAMNVLANMADSEYAKYEPSPAKATEPPHFNGTAFKIGDTVALTPEARKLYGDKGGEIVAIDKDGFIQTHKMGSLALHPEKFTLVAASGSSVATGASGGVRDVTPNAKATEGEQSPSPQPDSDFGKNNKIFTEDKAAKAREILRQKLAQVNTGIDPEMVQAGIDLAGFYIEGGARTFGEYAKKMIGDLGDAVKPHLKSWYAAVRFHPGFDTTGMDSLADLEKIDVDQLGKEPAKEEAPASAPKKEEQAPAPKAEEPPAESSQLKLAQWVQDRIGKNEPFNYVHLVQAGAEAYGSKLAEGKYTAKDLYDAMELGMNRFIAAHAPRYNATRFSAEDAAVVIDTLKRRTAVLATQSVRTEEQQEFQQFSTPPAYAFTAAWVANLNSSDTVLEPSAGIGGLAVFAKVAGVKEVVVNELSPRRAEFLKEMGFDRVFTENAEHLNSILPKDVQPTVIIMNPPFSATAGRKQGERDTMNGAKHIEQALKRLAPGGRLVAIVGEGMADDRPAFRKWWAGIKSEYTVRANVGVDGKGYAKYGTTFDNNMLVIDKTGPTTDTVVTGKVADIAEVPALLEGVRDGRQPITANAGSQPAAAQPGSKAVAGQGQGTPAGNGSVQPPTGVVGSGQKPSGKRAGASGNPGSTADPAAATGQAGTATANGVSGNGRPEPRPGVPASNNRAGEPATSGEPGGSSAGNNGGTTRASDSQPGLNVEATDTTAANDELTDSVFENYTPQRLKVPGAKPHPSPLVQSAAMAAVEPPIPTYKPSLPKDVVESGRVSLPQIEAVVYAGQAHEQMLPNGQRMGFFIGDGTGVGKGTENAAIILDNWNKGRKKAVWISEKQSLVEDAKRDLDWVGLTEAPLVNLTKTKLGSPLKNNEGVLFTTYDTLKSGAKVEQGMTTDQTRINQIVEWFGKDYDGVIIFDESHNMANNMEQKGKRGKKEAAAKALAGLKLAEELPNARVVYVSATGATEVNNLGYADRLGLWGEGTPFANKQSFVTDIAAGGVAAMELVARDMKAMGKYLARSLSFDGVTYSRLEHELTPEQTDIYNDLADAWQMVLRGLNEVTADMDGMGKGRAMGAFWGAHQRFFNQIITSMQTPAVIAQARKDLAEGKSIVMQLVNTDEANQERKRNAMQEGDTLDDLDLTPREGLMGYIRDTFPVGLWEEQTDANGNTVMVPVLDANGKQVVDADKEAIRDELLMKLGSIRVPSSPLDLVLDAFGHEAVAEVSGRKRRIVTGDDGAKVEQKRGRAAAESDANAFMEGKKRILVFSEAGGTGRSYHADLRAENKEKRMHYLLQAGWRADKAVQGLGRTHRTNEASQPHYYLVTTNLKAQARFISTIARRLDQLGSLTKGQRETGSQGLFSAKDNLESREAHSAYQQFLTNLVAGQFDFDVQEFVDQTGMKILDQDGNMLKELPPITQFLNRLLSLRTDMMDKVFDAFANQLDTVVEIAMQAGTLDVGIETVKALSTREIDSQVVYTDPKTGAETRYVQLELTQPATKLTFEDAISNHRVTRFVRNIKSGKIRGLGQAASRTTDTGAIVERFREVDPKGWRVINQSEITPDKYEEVGKADAEKYWQEEYDATPATRTVTEHLITGAILPIWDRLRGHARIVRVQTDTGKRMIGRLINGRDLSDVLRNLGATRTLPPMTPEQVAGNIIDNNTKFTLANGWELKRSKVGGEDRIELKGATYQDIQQLRQTVGAQVEQIQWQTRVFIPADSMGRLLQSKPVVDMQESRGSGVALYSNPFANPDLVVAELSKLTRDIKAAIPKLVELGKEIMAKGATTIKDFTSAMQARLGKLYDAFKGVMVQVYQKAKAANEKLGERGAVDLDGIRGLKGDFLEKMYAAAGKAVADKAETGSRIAAGIAKASEWAVVAAEQMSPLGHLQNKEAFLAGRYRALGKLDEINSAVKEIYRTLSMANATNDMESLYNYFTTRDFDVNAIRHPEVRRTAQAVKQQIVTIGDMLAEKGWLKPETHEETAGTYLPRVYLKHILGAETFAKWAGGKKLDKGYLKKRQDIPEEVRRIVLGEVTDAAYLAARAVSLPLRDLAVAEWLESIASDRENGWVLPRSLATWEFPEGSKPKKVSPFWLKSEAQRLRDQARHMPAADAAEARELADRMDDTANETLEAAGIDPANIDEVPQGYKKLPNSPRYGALRGMVVRSEIHNDIVGVGDIKLGDSDVVRSIFGATTKGIALWKWAKVAANPPAQVRNFITNMVLLHLSGVPFVRVPQRVLQAIGEILNNGPHWQTAKRYGVRGASFANVEMGRTTDDLAASLKSTPEEASWLHAVRQAWAFAKKWGYQKPGDMYQFLEAIGKTAKIIDMREREGSTEEAAALAAHDALFDYSLVPPAVRWARMSPIGAPFITFAYKSFPKLLEVATTRPWRFAPYLTLMAALPALVASMTGLDDDDMDKLKKSLPEWLQEKGHAFFLPVKDSLGRWQVIDLGYFFPWTPFTELLDELGKGEIGKAAQSLSLFGGPVISIIQAMQSGEDPFTRRKIVPEVNPTTGEQVAGWLAYLYRLGAPTWLTDVGFAGKVAEAYSEKSNKWGEAKTTPTQAALRLAGVNVYSADPTKTRVQNLDRMRQEIAALKREHTQQLREHPKMSPAKRLDLLREHQEKIREVQKRMGEYANDTRFD